MGNNDLDPRSLKAGGQQGGPTPMRPHYRDTEVPAAAAICTVLEEAGVEFAIGLPGGDVMRLFDALYDRPDTLRTVLVRDEALAGFMAESYGRTTGKPAVVICQGAWFLSKASTGALEALAGASPLVALIDLSDKTPHSHHSPTQTGTGDYGTWDAHQSLRGFMKVVMEARDPVQAVQLTQLALKHATSGSPGPVAVVYYSAALKGTVGPKSRPPLFASSGYLQRDKRGADAGATQQAATLLAQARKPVIIAGNGVRVSGAMASLAALAGRIGAPVVTSSAGKGVFAEVHPLAAGVIGEYGLDAAAAVVGEADVVLAVGTRLAPNETMYNHPKMLDPSRQALIQIDIEPRNCGWTHPVQCALVGDADAVLRELGAQIGADAAKLKAGEERVKRAATLGWFESAKSNSDAVPILPQRLVRELSEGLPDDVVVTADAGENRIFLLHHYRTRRAGGFLMASSMAGMGSGIPAAMGVKLAHPHRPVVAVVGDGGLGMSLAGLMTSLEEDLPITVVVMNNASLGWVRHVQKERPIASRLGQYDYAAIARSMGCEGIRVEAVAGIRPALKTALASKVTTVIDVVTSMNETWEDVACSLGKQS
jgi:acetolactate synthase-1/2/3 large subunit